MISHRKYGPPQVRPKPYSIMLELLETQANKKLTSEYTTEITLAMSRLEPISQVNPSMIDLQPEIQWFMRPFLLDFLIELHSSFKLQPQTLFLCLNIIDRYCAKRIVFKRHYQLVGCTALWIAAKYEDKKLRVPTLKELTIMCRNAYDEEMFIQMEMHILSTLEWCLSHPNLEDCLQLAISHSNINPNTTPCKYNVVNMKDPSSKELAPANSSSLSAITVVGRFLCELSLYNTYFLSVPVSLVSITANLLACSMLQIPNASDTLRDLIKDVLYNKKSANVSPLQPHGFNDASSHDSDYTDIDLSDDEENKQPEVHGAFLSGLDENSINTIKKIALMFIIQFSKTTEVLTKKYEALGVIQVINNFHSRFTYIVASVCEQQETITQEEVLDPKLLQLSEILLQFPKVEPETHLHNHRRQSTSSSASSSACSSNAGSPHTTPNHPFHSASTLHLNLYENGLHPITPPSATSQYSVFSNKRSNSACATPVHSNANMSVSSASSSILRNNKLRISKGKVSNYSTSSYSTSNISLNHPNPNPNIAHQSGGLPPPPPPPHRLNSAANNSVTEFSPLNNNGAGTSESTAWSSPIMHV